MKKNALLGMGALLLCNAALAQSSVTLYGVVDASISGYSTRSRLDTRSPAAALDPIPYAGLPDSLRRSATRLANSAYNSSRIGFRGTEDLGGGLSASFWLESQINNDDGSVGLASFGRRSTVSLAGPFGEIRLGRDYTPSFWNNSTFDPFVVLGVGASIINAISINAHSAYGTAPNGLPGNDNYGRASNTIGYFLPPGLGGFYGQAQYALHENVRQNGGNGNASAAGRYFGGRMGYANGPLDAAIAYSEDNKDGMAGFDKARLKTLNLGASYDLGAVKLFGELGQIRDEGTRSVAYEVGGIPLAYASGQTGKYTGALIGLTAPVGPALIRAAYSRVKYDAPAHTHSATEWQNDDATAEKLAIGLVYNLSKRTAIYATAAHIRLRWNGAVNPVMAATVGGGVNYATSLKGTAAAWRPTSSTGYDFGIRHAF